MKPAIQLPASIAGFVLCGAMFGAAAMRAWEHDDRWMVLLGAGGVALVSAAAARLWFRRE